MLPFFVSDCFQVIRRLLSRCIKPEHLDCFKEAKDIYKLDFSNTSIYLTPHKMDIGAAAKACLKQSKAFEKEILGFRVGVLDFMKAVVRKMMDKSPLNYKLVRCCAFMNPAVMLQDKAPRLLSQALDIMLEAKKINAPAADEVKDEFLQFCTEVKADSSDTHGLFLHFSAESTRVDKFLHTHIFTRSPKLWEFVKSLLLLSHGQASVERGFSFNKEISVENLKEHSVIAQRRVLQYIRQCGGTTEVPMSKALLTAAASGRQNYTAYLEREKERKRCEERKRKREEWDSELDQLKEKKKRLIREKDDLVQSADQLARQAEDKQNFSLLAKSNAMREKSLSKLKEVSEVDAAIQAKLNALAS